MLPLLACTLLLHSTALKQAELSQNAAHESIKARFKSDLERRLSTIERSLRAARANLLLNEGLTQTDWMQLGAHVTDLQADASTSSCVLYIANDARVVLGIPSRFISGMQQ